MVERGNGKHDQVGRFRKAARDLGADESGDALDRVMGKLDLTKKPLSVGEKLEHPRSDKHRDGKPE